ncbi:Fumarylacetoacetate (FAA) hydrolase family protein [Thalassoglobus neptunius]|uniref:Fumarylacetoacetate (FAA) hydrolase family protein n=1 Tax=Thalassoglobus neptunius TaxID=1938619 RepID=A0A5C5X7C0_9PLAN|nr:fumarylacetoacetate hydrolase family protein [Thalassoglobus neptunius]TWT58549.1 Fumarylacetoacetate (FAA) hydrolase family protein [Thalassoglobus neptunius]
MKLGKIQTPDGQTHVAIVSDTGAKLLQMNQSEEVSTLADILNSPNPAQLAESLAESGDEISLEGVRFLAPVDNQETWAAGVTYKRSQVARMEESETGASHYDRVYDADRPELFFKATPNRIVSPGEAVRVRYDSNWSVPEPEFTLVLNPQLKIVGYTIGNDMSARDIEGENPLYLPQAKVYRQCCSLGPVVRLADSELDLKSTTVELIIRRGGESVFKGETDLGQLHRKLDELADWLGREDDFPNGAFLLTGTGIVPDDNFTLEDGDEISISIAGIGSLENSVVKSDRPAAH